MPFSVDELKVALRGLDSIRYGADDLPGALRKIVRTTHDLFSVDGAALMLLDSEMVLRNAAVSDDRLSSLELLQERHAMGPCIDAFDQKALVSSEDLEAEDRWGQFPAAAVEEGTRAVLVSPIPYASDAIGVIAVFSASRHAWTPEGELAVTAFTDLAALAITSTLQSEQRGETAMQLQRTLDSRAVIEQAKGVLVARERITPRQALDHLRAEARSSRQRLTAVASRVVREAGSATKN